LKFYSYFAFKNAYKKSGQKSWSFHILHISRCGPLDVFHVQTMLINVLVYQVSDICPLVFIWQRKWPFWNCVLE